jgi:acyl-coenzyme A thioesterase PaaI-like protein
MKITVPRPDFGPDPDHPGWLLVGPGPEEMYFNFLAPIRLRVEGEKVARLRYTPGTRHRNIMDKAHGGYLLGLVDQALSIGPHALGVEGALGGVTIEVTSQFLAPVGIDAPIDVVLEVLRVTGRLIFTRGLIEQAGITALSFSGTLRRAPS